MKRDVRFLGIDDSPFRFEDARTRVVAVVTRGPGYIEGVLSTEVEVDGTDATDALLRMVAGTRFRSLLRAILLNGVTLGGFNVVDLDALHRGTGVPVVAIVRDRPAAEKVQAALEKHFPDAPSRIRRLSLQTPSPLKNGRYQVYASWRGVTPEEAQRIVESTTVRGAVPEPVRLAHVIASGIARGESRGPA